MRLRLINDPILREVCASLNESELDYVKGLVPEMTIILTRENGIALAANQVGVTKRFFILKRNDIVNLIINPEITSYSSPSLGEEGCLSIPGVSAKIARAQTISLNFRNEDFNECNETFSGIEAVAIQHEIDHLNGVLYVDKLEPLRKRMLLEKHRKFLKMKGRSK